MTLRGAPDLFAAVVRGRRRELNLTMAAVHAAGGPTVPTLVRTEKGDLQAPRPDTLDKFDRGLHWESGSAARAYWEGQEPLPAEPRRPRSLAPSEMSMPLSLERLLSLMHAQRDLNVAASLIEGGADLHTAVARINMEVSSMVGLFVTDLLERNRDEHSVHPLLEIAFGEALSTPVGPDDPEATEKRYRRWLLGKADELDRSQRIAFERRYQQKIRKDIGEESDG